LPSSVIGAIFHIFTEGLSGGRIDHKVQKVSLVESRKDCKPDQPNRKSEIFLKTEGSSMQVSRTNFFVGAMLALALFLGGCAEERIMDRAHELRREGKLEEALAKYYEVATQYPNSKLVPQARLWINRLEVWIRLESQKQSADRATQAKNYEYAVELYNRAIGLGIESEYPGTDAIRDIYSRVKPLYRDQLLEAAAEALRNGNPQKARRDYEKALQLTSAGEKDDLAAKLREVVRIIEGLEQGATSQTTQDQIAALQRRKDERRREEAREAERAVGFDWGSLFEIEDDDKPEIIYGDDEAAGLKRQNKTRLKELLKEIGQ
jgi:tetratricopeptide (TPR) repeat protein